MTHRLDELLRALPLPGVHVRFGSAGNCGGMLLVYLDVAAAVAYEFVDATPPEEDQELSDFCVVQEVLRRAGLTDLDFEYQGRVTIMP